MESKFAQQSSEINNNGNKENHVSIPMHKRSRRSPKRYGTVGQMNISGSSSDDGPDFSDNSFDDKNFELPSKVNVVATIKPHAKKNFATATTTTTTTTNLESDINLDDEFDSLSKSEPPIVNKMPINVEHNLVHRDVHNLTTERNNNSSEVLELLRHMSNQLNELAARSSLIEDNMMQLMNGSSVSNLMRDRKSSILKKVEESRIFRLTNRMPLQNLKDLEAFEENLKKVEYRNIAIEIFANDADITAAIGNQAKMLKVFIHKIIDRVFLAEFTWTGKSIGGRAKLPFKNMKNINDFLFDTMSTIDIGYLKDTFLGHLKNKILKYAYEHGNVKTEKRNSEPLTETSGAIAKRSEPDREHHEQMKQTSVWVEKCDRFVEFSTKASGPIAERSKLDRKNNEQLREAPIWMEQFDRIGDRYANHGYSDHRILPSSKLRKVEMIEPPMMRQRFVNNFEGHTTTSHDRMDQVKRPIPALMSGNLPAVRSSDIRDYYGSRGKYSATLATHPNQTHFNI